MSRGVRFAALAIGGLLLAGATSFAGGPAAAPAGGAGKLAGALDQPFTVSVAKVAARKGQPATATVVIVPAAGYHMNAEYPTSLTLRPPAGVTAAKLALNKADAKLSETKGSFDVVLTSASSGPKVVPADLRFAVCTATTCDPQKSTVSIQLDVQ
jgi:hypothetical protein